MSVAAENGRDETLGVGLFGGGSVGDHAPTEATAHQRRRSWCAARDGHADAVGCEAPAETRREGLGKRVCRREHGGVLGRVATAADDEATPSPPRSWTTLAICPIFLMPCTNHHFGLDIRWGRALPTWRLPKDSRPAGASLASADSIDLDKRDGCFRA